MDHHYDIVIVGSGLVGSSLAIALAGSGRRVLQVEALPEAALAERWDERHFVLAEASRIALADLGIWAHITRRTPITRILAQRAGEFGQLEFRADEQGVPALGYTVPASALQAALRNARDAVTGIERWQPATVVAMATRTEAAELAIERDGVRTTVQAALVVAADGAESTIRTMAGIGASRHDYGQTAVVAALRPARAEAGLALERLTDSGPLAILPVDAQRCGLIYTLPSAIAPQVQQMSEADFLARLREDLGDRLGRWLGVGARQLWPLKLTLAERLTGPRVVLVGNAAQAIHPVGAQGFNLGLRDAVALAGLLRADTGDAGSDGRLAAYAQARAADRAQTVRFSHGLVQFSAPKAPAFRAARFLAMTALSHLPPLRDRLARAAMGFR